MGRSVYCALDKNAVFAVSHQIADVCDQVRRLVILNHKNANPRFNSNYRSERTIGFDFRQLTKLIQNFSTYFLSNLDTNQIHVGPVIYQVGAENPLQPRLLFKPCFSVSLQVKIDPCRHHLHFSYPS